MRGMWLAAALSLSASAALAAPQIKQPDCAALEAWGAHVNSENFKVAPRLELPKALDDSQVTPLFGASVLVWTPEDLRSANQVLTKCYGEAGKRRDAAAASALANANRALQGLVPRVNAALRKATADAQAVKQQIAALPDSIELDRGLTATLKMNPAQPDVAPLRPLPHEIADPLGRLAAQVLPMLATTEREGLFKALAERHAAIQSGLVGKAEQDIAGAPATADGMLALMKIEETVAALDDAGAKTRLEKSAADRVQEIGNTLRQTKPAVWVPPDCLGLYRWAGANDATIGISAGGRGIMLALLDDRVIRVFGLSFAEWSDQDMARFKTLRALCQAEVQALAAPSGTDGANAPEMVQLAARARWLEAGDPVLLNARAGLVSYRTAQKTLADDLAKLKDLPDTVASLAPLAQMMQEPAVNLVPQDERLRFAVAINEKRLAISAQASEAAIKGLADVKVASIGDLKNYIAYAMQAVATIPDPKAQQAFRTAVNHSMEEAAMRFLPDFKAKLDAEPASFASLAAIDGDLARLTGIPDAGRSATFKPFGDAVAARLEAIKKSLYDQACGDFVASLGASGDAKTALWDGNDTTVGAFLCEIAEHANKVDSYSGTGLLSSTATLKVTPLTMSMMTISLHKAEVKAGKQMMVGYDVQDANRSNGQPQNAGPRPIGKISVDQWEFVTNDLIGFNGVEVQECMKVMHDPAPDKLAPAAKLLWLHCTTIEEVRTRLAAERAGAPK